MTIVGRWGLPATWTWVKATDIATVVGGGTPSNAKDPANYKAGGTPWVTPADLSGYRATHISKGSRDLSEVGFSSCSARLLPAGTVLMSSRAPVGYSAIAANDICTNQGFKSFVLRSPEISPEFMRYYLLASKQYLESEASGTTFLELSGSRTEQLLFPLAPAAEQRRIVSRVDELFSDIEEGERALERVQKLVERYRQSVLKAAVTGELTREWRERHKGRMESGEALLQRILKARREAWETAELAKMKSRGDAPSDHLWKRRYQEPTAPTIAGLAKLPTGWAWVTLPMLCALGSTNGISVKGSNTPPGVPALRLDAMLASGFDYSAKRYIPITEDQAERLRIAEGDFFVSRANGSLRLVGRAVLANEPPERVVFPDTMIRYRPIAEPDLRTWLAAIWASRLVRAQIERRAKTTAGIYKISQEDLSEIALPLPPLEEQRLIVDALSERMSQIQHLLPATQEVGRQSDAVRQAVLKHAFAGQLVAQDITDEPASALLERLRDLRAADQELTRVRAGRSKPNPLAKVMNEHGMQPQAQRRTRTPRGV